MSAFGQRFGPYHPAIVRPGRLYKKPLTRHCLHPQTLCDFLSCLQHSSYTLIPSAYPPRLITLIGMDSTENSFNRFPHDITLAALSRVPLCTKAEEERPVTRSRPTKPLATKSLQTYEASRTRPGLPSSSLFLPAPDPHSPTPADRRANLLATRPRAPLTPISPPNLDDALAYAYEALKDLYDGFDYFTCPAPVDQSPVATQPQAVDHAEPRTPDFVRALTVADAMDFKRPPPPDGHLVPQRYHWILHLGCKLLPSGPNCVCFDDVCRAALPLDAMGRHIVRYHRVQVQVCCDFCPLTFISDDGLKRHVRDTANHAGRSGEERRKLLKEFEGQSTVIQMRASFKNRAVSEVDGMEDELNVIFEQMLKDRLLGKRPLKSRGKTPLAPPFRF
ncbi:hypothetical protein R3P38DRAFT_3537552 [Favolaschia claudopus]|uniref:C2H2-type domain-containing protein n=1 Tax=Favolaschia claudopus TaxID=2862362 RepID=A0AAW0BBC3_9AGAR